METGIPFLQVQNRHFHDIDIGEIEMNEEYFEKAFEPYKMAFPIFTFEDEPILYVVSWKSNLILVDCLDFRQPMKWVSGTTSINTLLSLIDQRISVHDALKENGKVDLIELRGDKFISRYVDLDELDKHNSPDKDALVKFPDEDALDNIKKFYLEHFFGQTIF